MTIPQPVFAHGPKNRFASTPPTSWFWVIFQYIPSHTYLQIRDCILDLRSRPLEDCLAPATLQDDHGLQAQGNIADSQ